MIATNSCGKDTLILASYIQVIDPVSLPVASFNYSSLTVCPGDSVTFTNTSTNANSYVWSFTGGSPSTSTLANPKVLFQAGSQSVTLIATGPGGADTVSQSVTISIGNLPTAGLSTTDTLLTLPSATAFFTNTSVNASNYLWNFGDGFTITDVAPFHTYTAAGVYTVSLTATNSCGSDVITLIDFITVTDGSTPPTASFSYSNTTICGGEAIQFTNTSVNSNAWYWNFGTGSPSFSTAQHPSASFPDGAHNVSLIAFGNGNSDTISQQLTVTNIPLPVAAFTANDTLFLIPNTNVFFTNTSQNAVSYFWDFGDGSNTTDIAPWHHYVAAGNYTVSLIAFSSFCGNDTLVLSDFITIEDPLGAIIFDLPDAIAVFPNPFLDEITIQIPDGNESPVNVALMDITGRCIFQEEMEASGILNVHELACGVYFVAVTTELGKNTYRLVKE